MPPIETERLERKVDAIQKDLTSLRRDFELFRDEVRAGFDRLERIVIKALDRCDS